MRRFISLFVWFFLVISLQTSVFAQTDSDGIKSLLEERDEEIKNILGPEGSEYTEEQRETLKTIINGIIDFEAMSKTALDDTYDEISEESRKEFVDLFSTIIRDNSLTKLDIYRAEVSYNEIEIDGEKALVQTMAELDEVRTPVDYKMEWKEGEWVITDMSIDDVYTAESYKRQFQRIIARRGFDALMDSLRKRAARA
ncbi:MAG: ABC transporter substrate-binding protein [Balneolaceae bacterium]|nr:ABC transporter substrate-binding protein [Balneolaceae bacterium]